MPNKIYVASNPPAFKLQLWWTKRVSGRVTSNYIYNGITFDIKWQINYNLIIALCSICIEILWVIDELI